MATQKRLVMLASSGFAELAEYVARFERHAANRTIARLIADVRMPDASGDPSAMRGGSPGAATVATLYR
jgi:hypothetical protein